MEKPLISFNDRQEGLLRCERCGKTKIIKASYLYGYRDIGNRTNVRVRCVCGHTFYVVFNLRRSRRRDVKFPGKLLQVAPGCVYYDVTVTSLSLHGIGFLMPAPTTIDAGRLFDIVVPIDAERHTVLFKRICIRYRKERFLGAIFCGEALHPHIFGEPFSVTVASGLQSPAGFLTPETLILSDPSPTDVC